MINKLSSADINFKKQLDTLLDRKYLFNKKTINDVENIMKNVRINGDSALLKYSIYFDKVKAKNINDLLIKPQKFEDAFNSLNYKEKNALKIAARRIKKYHQKQKQKSWSYTEKNGTMLGQKVTPLDRVGLYVPGGKASYPSSVLMNAIPAKIAGVGELIMATPAKDGKVNKLVLAAAHIAQVDQIFTIGGAQAIAAFTYGSATIKKVDKIIGPGNIYVTIAKRLVFGIVGIDMLAGPSEILIICDGTTNPDWIAMDLFSQAEHDENAQAILLSPDTKFINQVENSINKLLPSLKRKNIITKALKNKGALITTKNLNEAVAIANKIAPEHLELSVEEPLEMLKNIKHAGAIFIGSYSSEALGDYCAGPNHVLPTSGSARFFSPLGVYDFQKKSNLIMISNKAANTLGKVAATLATSEGLEAHARSATYRITL